MAIGKRLKLYLDSEIIDYDLVSHPRTMTSSESAQVAHISGEQMIKSVVIHHELGYLLAVVPSTHRIDLGTLQNLVGTRLGLASETETSAIFSDCGLGAIPPSARPMAWTSSSMTASMMCPKSISRAATIGLWSTPAAKPSSR